MSLHAQLHKYLRVYPQWNFLPPRAQVRRSLQHFGSDYGGYRLDPSIVSEHSVVYSLGVGQDISFDLSLIVHADCIIYAFDPTPQVAAWLATQSLPPQLQFRAVGIAGHDGNETFYLPPRPDWISHSVLRAEQYSADSVLLPVVRLSTAMCLQGHRQIDVLKMDIEGAEYAVIEEIVREQIPVTQLVVEFHHRLSGVGTGKTREALALLQRHGMRVAYVCPRREIFTFIRTA